MKKTHKTKTTQTTQMQDPLSIQSQPRNCIQGDCYPVQGMPSKTVVTDSPKEEMPIRWEIPHSLLDGHIQQATMKMWLGARISNE